MEIVLHKGFLGNATIAVGWDWWHKQVPELYNIPTESLGDLLDQIHQTTKREETPEERFDRAWRAKRKKLKDKQ